ncbi:MAG: hypothetical protein EA377_09520 [Phycisphaerales bacterium]|nr:MAG: hypothetical protein EA377_09520 [Phycisphaerales bacterium]
MQYRSMQNRPGQSLAHHPASFMIRQSPPPVENCREASGGFCKIRPDDAVQSTSGADSGAAVSESIRLRSERAR